MDIFFCKAPHQGNRRTCRRDNSHLQTYPKSRICSVGVHPAFSHIGTHADNKTLA